jgi:hypothetical protein
MYLQRQQRRAILKDGDGFVRDPAGGCKVPEPFGRLEKVQCSRRDARRPEGGGNVRVGLH